MKLINEEIITELNEMGKRIDIFEEYIHNPENYGENYNSIEDKEIRSLVIQLYVYYNMIYLKHYFLDTIHLKRDSI